MSSQSWLAPEGFERRIPWLSFRALKEAQTIPTGFSFLATAFDTYLKQQSSGSPVWCRRSGSI